MPNPADELRTALRTPVDPVWMSEVVDVRPLPLATVVGFRLVDCVAHAWDLADATRPGRPTRPAERTAQR